MKERGRRSNDRGASKEANQQLAWALLEGEDTEVSPLKT